MQFMLTSMLWVRAWCLKLVRRADLDRVR